MSIVWFYEHLWSQVLVGVNAGPTWKPWELAPVILVLLWPVQLKGTAIFIGTAWLGDQFRALIGKIVLAHIDILRDTIVVARNQ